MADPVPARWPHATITMEARTFAAVVIDWKRLNDANGYPTWHARCLYWDNEPKVALIPQMRVHPVGQAERRAERDR